jgi:GR25 family glycosyltransferase involved in LPS biosynthesis
MELFISYQISLKVFIIPKTHMNIFDLYIIHNPVLSERKSNIQKMLDNSGQPHFVEIENCAPELLKLFYKGMNPESWYKKCRCLYHPPPKPRELTKGEVAATVSHFYSYMHFLSNSKKDWIVVLEDDAVFESGLIHRIECLLNDCPARADALFIGGGYQHDAVSLTVGVYKSFFIKHHPATNTTVGYAIRRRLISNIMNSFDFFDLPSDFELAYLLMINNSLVLHSNPYLISEGSKSIYNSCLR